MKSIYPAGVSNCHQLLKFGLIPPHKFTFCSEIVPACQVPPVCKIAHHHATRSLQLTVVVLACRSVENLKGSTSISAVVPKLKSTYTMIVG